MNRQELRCPLDDRFVEETREGFVHTDDGSEICVDVIEIVEVS